MTEEEKMLILALCRLVRHLEGVIEALDNAPAPDSAQAHLEDYYRKSRGAGTCRRRLK